MIHHLVDLMPDWACAVVWELWVQFTEDEP